MKQGWEIKKLGEVCDFYRGLTYSKKDEVEISSTGVLRSNNIDLANNQLNLEEIKYISDSIIVPKDKKIKKGSLLICTANGSKSHLGKVALIDEDYNYAFGGFMGLMVPHKQIMTPKYFYYSLITSDYKNYIKKLSDGANINNLKFKDLQLFEIPVPSLLEQGRIVGVLDAAFAKIDALKENAQKNLENAKALFQQVLKQELTPKPNWQTKKLSEIATDFSRGKSKHRPRNDKKLFGGNYPFIQTGDIRNSQKYVKKFNETYNEFGLSQSKLWPKGTLCITIAANIAETAILDFPCCFPDSVIGLVPNNKLVDVNFIYFTLLLYKNELQNLGKGSAQDNINLGTFEKNQFPFPTKKEQEEIVMTIDAISQKCSKVIANAEKTIAECDALKQAVLRRAFNGEL